MGEILLNVNFMNAVCLIGTLLVPTSHSAPILKNIERAFMFKVLVALKRAFYVHYFSIGIILFYFFPFSFFSMT